MKVLTPRTKPRGFWGQIWEKCGYSPISSTCFPGGRSTTTGSTKLHVPPSKPLNGAATLALPTGTRIPSAGMTFTCRLISAPYGSVCSRMPRPRGARGGTMLLLRAQCSPSASGKPSTRTTPSSGTGMAAPRSACKRRLGSISMIQRQNPISGARFARMRHFQAKMAAAHPWMAAATAPNLRRNPRSELGGYRRSPKMRKHPKGLDVSKFICVLGGQSAALDIDGHRLSKKESNYRPTRESPPLRHSKTSQASVLPSQLLLRRRKPRVLETAVPLRHHLRMSLRIGGHPRRHPHSDTTVGRFPSIAPQKTKSSATKGKNKSTLGIWVS
mmetsp:Transcript_26150/g.58598  ORF Transcript_26150/g.58598 Transcript_26150/m.58598 type:complete len:328 (+) Transcript_26150:1365-2348(+)